MAAFKPLPLTSPTAMTRLPSAAKGSGRSPHQLPRGQKRGFNVAAGKGRNRYGDQPLLDLPRGFEFSGCPFVLKGGAPMAEQQDRADGDQEEEHRQVVKLKRKRPTWKSLNRVR